MARVDLASVNLNVLVALDALLQTGSVSEAARAVHVSTSAMSHSLATLRELFGDTLLVRTARGMVRTPMADALANPLREILGGVSRLLDGGPTFERSVASRRFVIAAPDFLATLLLPHVIAEASREAPGVELAVLPSARRGNAWRLESGEIDLALGAVVDDAPGIRRRDLCTEGFACAVRADHPTVGRRLTLDDYCTIPHLMITLGDDDTPTWIDEALARVGRTRRVAVRVRYFMSAPLLVARSDLLMTGPAMLIDYFAGLVPLRVLDPPIALPSYPEELYWHARYDDDPGHRWLRELLVRSAAGLGTGRAPQRRRWREDASKGARKRRKRGS